MNPRLNMRIRIWIVSFVIAVVALIIFTQLRPDLFGEYLSLRGLEDNNLELTEVVALAGGRTYDPGRVIGLLTLALTFLLMSNLLHLVFYRSTRTIDTTP